MKPILLSLALFVAVAAHAQSAAEFGHASGGQISVIAKQPRQTSGSFDLAFGNGSQRYGATFGGTLANDRLWFFGSAMKTRSELSASGQPVDWNHIDLSIAQQKPQSGNANTFLSLNSFSVLSPSTTLSISLQRQ